MLAPQLLELLRQPVVARGAARQSLLLPGGLAVSRPRPGRAAVGPPAPAASSGAAARAYARDHQARLAAHTAAQLRHPPARTRRRCPRRIPDAARPRQARHHRALYTRVANTTIRAVTSPLDRLAYPDRRQAATRGLAGGRAPPEPGGRRYLSSSWGRLAPRQCRPCEPGSAPGHVGDRAVPLGRARRPCRALRGLRPPTDRL